METKLNKPARLSATDCDTLADAEGVTLSAFDVEVHKAAMILLNCTDEGEFLTSELIPCMGWEDSFKMRHAVSESLRKLDAAGLLPHVDVGERDPWETWAGEADTMMEPADENTEPEADEITKPKSYPLGNMAECLDALEACGEDEEIRDAIVRKFRAWLGIPDYWKCAIEKEAAVRDLRARMDAWAETI